MSHRHREQSSRPHRPSLLRALFAPGRRAGAAGSIQALAAALLLGLGLAACAGGGEGDDEGCEVGNLNCMCFANATCLAGLACTGNVCVPPSGTSAGTTTSDGSTSAGTSSGETSSAGTTAGTTNGTTNGTTTDGTTTDGTTGTTGSVDGGPMVVDFGTNVKKITEGESVIFTATITDPDGPDDIQGGSLKSADESLTYGAFSDLGNGTYELTLTWAAIDQAIGIEFIGMDTVDFKAVFYDNEGKKGVATTSIDLTCGADYAVIACDGHCVEADTDEDHCGTCGTVCDGDAKCDYGSCTGAYGACQVTANTPYNTCAEFCQAQGQGCVDKCAPFSDASIQYWQGANTCTDLPSSDHAYDAYACDQDFYFDPNLVGALQCCCSVDAVWPPK